MKKLLKIIRKYKILRKIYKILKIIFYPIITFDEEEEEYYK
jgi:hypothetical protein